MANQNNIGQRIRAARKKKGINQTELAHIAGQISPYYPEI